MEGRRHYVKKVWNCFLIDIYRLPLMNWTATSEHYILLELNPCNTGKQSVTCWLSLELQLCSHVILAR